MLLDGSKIVKKYKNKLITKFKKLNKKAKLAIVVLNGLENQKDFLNFKNKFANSIGVEVNVLDWSHLTTEQCLIELKKIELDSTIDGIIIQLPANKNIDTNILLENIPINKDVDGLNPKQFKKKRPFLGASNVGITKIIKKYNFLKNKKILLIGRNPYFSAPLYNYLKLNKYKIEMIKYNQYKPWMNSIYDIIISTVNKPLYINTRTMKRESLAIDLTYYKDKSYTKPVGAFYGDVNHLKVFTPVPGGLGPLTVYYLFDNLYKIIKNNLKNKK